MLKQVIKRIDEDALNGRIVNTYKRVREKMAHYWQYPKITPLPSGIYSKFGLRARYDFFQAAQYYLQVNRIDGVYLEFGCHELNTFRMALNTLGAHGRPNHITRFYAFDSFEGMPTPMGIDQQRIWRAGMNATSVERFYRMLRKDASRIEPVKGYYRDTLRTFRLPEKSVPALVYIDCDYYSSTKEVLDFLKGYLCHGVLLAFDDWDCYYGDPSRGQRKAFDEFRDQVAPTLQFVEFLRIQSGGQSFICHEVNKVGKEVL